jgi:hypothetical protein
MKKYLLTILLTIASCLVVNQAHASIAFVSSAATNVNSVSLTVNVTVNNLLIVSCQNTNGASFSNPSDTIGNTFHAITTVYSGSAGYTSAYYAISSGTNTTDSVSCSFSGNSPSIAVSQYSGIAQTSPLDISTTTTTGYSGTAVSPSFTTAQASELAYYIAWGSGGDLTGCTASDGASNTYNARVYQPTGTSYCTGDSIYSTVATNNNITVQNGGHGEYWAALFATFKGAGGSVAATPIYPTFQWIDTNE